MNSEIIFSIASDHAGFELKEEIVNELKKQNIACIDNGVFDTSSVDYPDYAKLVCEDVRVNKAKFGILVCSSGVGMSISANKCEGIRSLLCMNTDMAEYSRLHNNANVICFGAKYLDIKQVMQMINIFKDTEFEGGRHQRRVEKLMNLQQ